MRMVVVLAAVSALTTPAAAQTPPEPTASRMELSQQADAAFEKGIAAWRDCLMQQAGKLVHSNEPAETIAAAAMTNCREWDAVLKPGLARALALSATELPLETALELTAKDADEYWTQYRQKAKELVMAAVVTAKAER